MYIDPNTGGMLFQVLAVFLAFFSGFILLFSSKIRAGAARLRRAVRRQPPEDSTPPDSDKAPGAPGAGGPQA
jgi:uncharacterized iron-regulated membrane protein